MLDSVTKTEPGRSTRSAVRPAAIPGHRRAEPAGEIRVAVADGHSLVRSGMQRLLSEQDGISVVSSSSSFDEAIRHLRGHRPDVLVYDPSAEEEVEICEETIDALKDASPGTAILVLSPGGDAGLARTALRAGAAGFVGKGEDVDALAGAVRSAASGEAYINGRLAIDIARLEASDEADGLTEREAEILRLIALGHTNAEIAKMLFLSIRTVESHRAHILEKLRLDSRAELVQYAIDRRLIP
jgi:two-component system response regulator NreC